MKLVVSLLFILLPLSAADSKKPKTTCGQLTPQSQLNSWLKEWQSKLGMIEWTIGSIEQVRAEDLKPETIAHLDWDIDNKKANIKVLTSLGHEGSCLAARSEQEASILHELVHLQLSVLPRDLNYKLIEEKVVKRITNALLKEKYRKRQ